MKTADRVATANFLPESVVRYLGQGIDLAGPVVELRAAGQAMAGMAADAEIAAAFAGALHESAIAQAAERLTEALIEREVLTVSEIEELIGKRAGHRAEVAGDQVAASIDSPG